MVISSILFEVLFNTLLSLFLIFSHASHADEVVFIAADNELANEMNTKTDSKENSNSGNALNVSSNINTIAKNNAKKNQENEEKIKIDWSKPVVSRGFGLEESQGHADDAGLKQYQSGQVFYFFGEYDKAVEKWLPLLEQNFPEAQASMGWLYQAGLGVKKNESLAFELYMKAAKQNNAIAQNNLGVMYENAIAIDKDLDMAKYWYQRSAEQGYRFGEYNLANLLLLNRASGNNLEQAKLLLQKSAKQGVQQASEKLKALL